MIEVPVIIIQPAKEIMPIKFLAKTRRGLFQSIYLKFLKDAERGINYTPFELKQLFQEALQRDTFENTEYR